VNDPHSHVDADAVPGGSRPRPGTSARADPRRHQLAVVARVLRTSALIFAGGNFVFSGIYLVFVVIAKRAGLSPAAIGALIAIFGGASLAGSLLAPRIARRLSMRAIMLGNEC